MSYPGRVEIYVTWDSAEDQAALAKEMDMVAMLLPAGSAKPTMTTLPAGDAIPAHPTGEEEVMLVQFDREKLAAFSISHSVATNAAKDLLSTGSANVAAMKERFQSLTINVDGREVPFKDIATVNSRTEPKCVVRR
jgi:hypothetical protein